MITKKQNLHHRGEKARNKSLENAANRLQGIHAVIEGAVSHSEKDSFNSPLAGKMLADQP